MSDFPKHDLAGRAEVQSMTAADTATAGPVAVAWLVERLNGIWRDDDHERGCQGRMYECTCGFDERTAATAEEAASALASLQAQVEALTRERDEARSLVTEANNSLYGSQGYFHSLDGGPFDKYHLASGIEKLKANSREQWRLTTAAEAEVTRLRAALEPLLNAASGLSFGTDWNNGTHAMLHGSRQKLLDAIPAARAALTKEPNNV